MQLATEITPMTAFRDPLVTQRLRPQRNKPFGAI